jgi:hypothetical protein
LIKGIKGKMGIWDNEIEKYTTGMEATTLFQEINLAL